MSLLIRCRLGTCLSGRSLQKTEDLLAVFRGVGDRYREVEGGRSKNERRHRGPESDSLRKPALIDRSGASANW